MEVDVAGRIIYFYGSDMVFQWEFHHDSHAEYRPIEGFDSLWFTVYMVFHFDIGQVDKLFKFEGKKDGFK